MGGGSGRGSGRGGGGGVGSGVGSGGCICENKGADQLRGIRAANQRFASLP